MHTLALDTTTREGSVALLVDDRVIDERRGDRARTHAERLPAELVAVAGAHGIGVADVDLFAVAAGPGSFTGMRIGIATIQGLAFAARRPVVGVSALEALAHIAGADRPRDAIVAAWMDAQRRDVFAALYRVGDAAAFDPARLTILDGPLVGDPAVTLARWMQELKHRPDVVIGDGASRFGDLIARELAGAQITGMPALAGAVGRLAVARAARGEAVDPAGIQPLYVRRPDAEVDRERRTQP